MEASQTQGGLQGCEFKTQGPSYQHHPLQAECPNQSAVSLPAMPFSWLPLRRPLLSCGWCPPPPLSSSCGGLRWSASLPSFHLRSPSSTSPKSRRGHLWSLCTPVLVFVSASVCLHLCLPVPVPVPVSVPPCLCACPCACDCAPLCPRLSLCLCIPVPVSVHTCACDESSRIPQARTLY